MVASNICTWECSGSGCFNTWMEPFLHQDVVNLVVTCSTLWMAYGCLGCLQAQGYCRLQSLGAWVLCHWSPDCRKVHKLLPNLLVHLLQLSRSYHLVQPECPILVFDWLETGVPCRTHHLHGHHSWMLVHGTVERACSQPHCHESAWNWATSYDTFHNILMH